jgi:hypothetical protein
MSTTSPLSTKLTSTSQLKSLNNKKPLHIPTERQVLTRDRHKHLAVVSWDPNPPPLDKCISNGNTGINKE